MPAEPPLSGRRGWYGRYQQSFLQQSKRLPVLVDYYLLPYFSSFSFYDKHGDGTKTVIRVKVSLFFSIFALAVQVIANSVVVALISPCMQRPGARRFWRPLLWKLFSKQPACHNKCKGSQPRKKASTSLLTGKSLIVWLRAIPFPAHQQCKKHATSQGILKFPAYSARNVALSVLVPICTVPGNTFDKML